MVAARVVILTSCIVFTHFNIQAMKAKDSSRGFSATLNWLFARKKHTQEDVKLQQGAQNPAQHGEKETGSVTHETGPVVVSAPQRPPDSAVILPHIGEQSALQKKDLVEKVTQLMRKHTWFRSLRNALEVYFLRYPAHVFDVCLNEFQYDLLSDWLICPVGTSVLIVMLADLGLSLYDLCHYLAQSRCQKPEEA